MKFIYSCLFILLACGAVSAQKYSGTIKHGVTKSTYFIASIVPTATAAGVQFTNIDITIRIPHQAGNINQLAPGVASPAGVYTNLVPFTKPQMVVVQNFTNFTVTQNEPSNMFTDGTYDYYLVALTGATWVTNVTANTAKDILELRFSGLSDQVTASPELIDYASGPAGLGGPSFSSYFYVENNNGDQTNYANMMINDLQGVGASNSSTNANAGIPARTGISHVGLNSPNVPLPIKLLTFTAAKTNDSRVQLNWQTSMEQGSDYFEVERAIDGKTFNTSIRRMLAAGNSVEPLDYQTYDNAPLNGTNYYRLKMVDVSGKVAYSEVRAVKFGTDRSYSMSPNPATSMINVTGMNAGASIIVMSTTGQVISQTTATAATQKIDLNMVPGLYYVQIVEDGNIVYNEKFVKQ